VRNETEKLFTVTSVSDNFMLEMIFLQHENRIRYVEISKTELII
jgi:hypothetical protein